MMTEETLSVETSETLARNFKELEGVVKGEDVDEGLRNAQKSGLEAALDTREHREEYATDITDLLAGLWLTLGGSRQHMAIRRHVGKEITNTDQYKHMMTQISRAQAELFTLSDTVSLQSYGLFLGFSEVCLPSQEVADISSKDVITLMRTNDVNDEKLISFNDSLLTNARTVMGLDFVEKHEQQLKALFSALSNITKELAKLVKEVPEDVLTTSFCDGQLSSCHVQTLSTIKVLTGCNELPELVREKVDGAYKGMEDFITRPKEEFKDVEKPLDNVNGGLKKAWEESFKSMMDIFTSAQETLLENLGKSGGSLQEFGLIFGLALTLYLNEKGSNLSGLDIKTLDFILHDMMTKATSEMDVELLESHEEKLKATISAIINVSKALGKAKEDVSAAELGQSFYDDEKRHSFYSDMFSTLKSYTVVEDLPDVVRGKVDAAFNAMEDFIKKPNGGALNAQEDVMFIFI